MITRKPYHRVPALCSIIAFSTLARGHMEMSWPWPLRSKHNPLNSHENIDYSNTSPLAADGSNFPCKGYQNDSPDSPMQPVATYATGSTYNITLEGSATHGSGSCQISLSYDNAATFTVIKSIIGGCPLTPSYDFTIPSDAPTGNALLAWTWQNLIGNREFYMNCAEVNIISGLERRRHRKHAFNGFKNLPDIWKANLKDINDCVTVENVTVVYPESGQDVSYGDGLDSSTPPTPGDCDAATPYGRTYEGLAAESISLSSSTERATDQDGPTIPASLASSSSSVRRVSTSSGSYSTMSSSGRRTPASSESYSTTTVTVNCQTTITLNTMPSYYLTAAPPGACTGTSASCPCALGYGCVQIQSCLWGCKAMPRTTTATSYPQSNSHPRSQSTRIITSVHTVVPVKPSNSVQLPVNPPPKPSSPHPPYAGTNVDRYLPCVPGTFICIDKTTWDTCDHNAQGQWAYQYPRKVAAGMECITFLSPFSGAAQQNSQQGSTPHGYYRDDRIVRARPYGDCMQDGAIRCTGGGQSFEVCDQGGWLDMGSVASGTRCMNGRIV